MADVTASTIRKSLESITPYIHRTPLIYSNSFSKLFGSEIYLKAENLQKTGSFKVRGAVNKLITMKAVRVIAVSMGNHAQGVAHAAASLGKEATIVMPETASLVKQEATKGYGAEVLLHGRDFGEALDYAMSRKECAFIHPFDDDDVIAGQGTVGIEIIEDLKESLTILVPVGGGGLLAGVAAAVKELAPGTRVIGVQAEQAPSAAESYRAGRIIERKPEPTIADGIAVGKVGTRTFDLIRNYADDIITVGEESIAMAVLLFLERKKLVVEGAGAVGLAALIENRERFRGGRVVVVLSGGNIDFTLVDRIITRGLVSSGRIGIFRVILDDSPGSLHRLTGVIASKGGNILHVMHDRLQQSVQIGSALVVLTIEAKGAGHLEEIRASLQAGGFTLMK